MINKKSNTCIAAIKVNNKIMIASDRRVTWNGDQYQTMPRSKTRKRNGILISATGDSYLCTLMVDQLEIPTAPTKPSLLDKYIHNTLRNKILKLLTSKQFINEHDALDIGLGRSAEILVAVRGHLFQFIIQNMGDRNSRVGDVVEADEVNLPYATGCGGLVALGSLITTDTLKYEPKKRLELALTVASQVMSGCDSNIDVISE